MGKKTILLVSPEHHFRNMWTLKETAVLLGRKTSSYPMALPYLAAMTPSDYSLVLIDEEMETIPPRLVPDLVGISTMVFNIARAFEIGDHFRAMGVPVIMGGPYTSQGAEECLRHCDTVVIGEAETLWRPLLQDFEAGRMKQTYKAAELPDITSLPAPRWDLVRTKDVLSLNVQVSRGCPMGCDFCCVPMMYGVRQRYRNVDNVIAEIKTLPSGSISFVDDNLTANKEYANELFDKLMPLGVSWNCLTSYDVANDPELLEKMAKAGCHTILIGFESLDMNSLQGAKKKQKHIGEYARVAEKINRAGMHVTGAFIVGFDQDTSQTFNQIYDFFMEIPIAYLMLNILTVFPGTALHKKMEKQGRVFPIDPVFMNGMFPTITYENINELELFDTYVDFLVKVYSRDTVWKKVDQLFSRGNFATRRKGFTLREMVKNVNAVMKHFIFSRESGDRKFFLDMVRHARKKKYTLSIVMEYLVFMEASRRYSLDLLNKKEEYRALLAREYQKAPR